VLHSFGLCLEPTVEESQHCRETHTKLRTAIKRSVIEVFDEKDETCNLKLANERETCTQRVFTEKEAFDQVINEQKETCEEQHRVREEAHEEELRREQERYEELLTERKVWKSSYAGSKRTMHV